MPEILPECPERDADAVETLFDATFGPGHFAKTAERLREHSRALPAISRVARRDGHLLAVCRVWPVWIGGQAGLFFGPVAVAPEHRGARLGLDVTRAACAAGQDAGWPLGLLIGAPDYFSHAGFQPLPRGQVSLPGPQDEARILARVFAATPGVCAGAVRAAPELAVAPRVPASGHAGVA